jgi:hypothetical protein
MQKNNWFIKKLKQCFAFLNFDTTVRLLEIIILGAGLYFAITQVIDLRKVNAGQIVLDINRDIYSNTIYKTNPEIIRLIERSKPILIENGGKYQYQDLDNLLGEWDTVARLNQTGVIPDDLAYAQFSFDMVKAYQNKEIMDYIKLTRQQSNDNLIFSDFEWLAKWMEQTSQNK